MHTALSLCRKKKKPTNAFMKIMISTKYISLLHILQYLYKCDNKLIFIYVSQNLYVDITYQWSCKCYYVFSIGHLIHTVAMINQNVHLLWIAAFAFQLYSSCKYVCVALAKRANLTALYYYISIIKGTKY